MKSSEEISSEIARAIIADPDTNVTFVGIKGSLRGYIDAVALKIRDLWYDITQAKRDSIIDTCTGAALDQYIGQRSGLTRMPASKSGVLLILSHSPTVAAKNIPIPAGTIVTNPTTKIQYITQETITVAAKNPDLRVNNKMNLKTISIADIVWAECSIEGVVGRAPANSITQIGVTGITVNNPAPAQGGSDAEDDDSFRQRYKDYIKVLNKNTKAYYQAVVRYYNSEILRSFIEKDYTHPDTMKLTVVKKSGNPFTSGYLTELKNIIQENNRCGEIVNCVNIDFTYITVELHVSLIGENGALADRNQYFADTADAIAKHLDWSKWTWGKAVSVDNLFTVCQQVRQVADIELSTFKVNGKNTTSVPVATLPYFFALKIVDISNPSGAVVRETAEIFQSFENVVLEPEVI